MKSLKNSMRKFAMQPFARLLAILVAALGITLSTDRVLADDDCNDPIAQWQPRELLKQQLEARGWTVYRIRVDDGCYKVRGVDEQGRQVEATYSPAAFELRELELEDAEHERREREHREERRPH